ncbi:hypothetical protein ACFPZL_08300 [Leucobacter soli]|uniref:Uncharacterized protein n=1 Tax=Leucobacter soli TaxID=2812850 RepID=A0A916JXX7_9MICO|nr:hypothetical protein [Leucobacter soli]CAG7605066.1 hypothetical protein LEUCIP111803_00792 [Leucobacter soli]
MDTQQSESNTELFEPGSAPAAGGALIGQFLISIILVFGGFYLMAVAPSYLDGDGHIGFWIFAAALAACSLGFWTAFRGTRQ